MTGNVMDMVRGDREAGRISSAAGFRSIVVALDLESGGDRALPVVRALAELGGLAVELVTVSSPNIDEDLDTFELRRRAATYGWPNDACTIVHSNEPAAAIVDQATRRGDALLVMATSAKRALTGLFLGSVTEEVLGLIDQPVLLVGPRVPPDSTLTHPTLVACVDESGAGEAAVPAIATWIRTFPCDNPWVAEVLPARQPGVAPIDLETAYVDGFVGQLADEGVAASPFVLYGSDPDACLVDLGRRLDEPIFVATSVRWTDGRLHWHSTTRRLVQRSIRPVLVIPARHNG